MLFMEYCILLVNTPHSSHTPNTPFFDRGGMLSFLRLLFLCNTDTEEVQNEYFNLPEVRCILVRCNKILLSQALSGHVPYDWLLVLSLEDSKARSHDCSQYV